jgi:hypothetical protein
VCLTLPTFVALALQQLVKESNAAHPDREPWTVSLLVERWLMNAFTEKERARMAEAIGPEFKAAAERWTRTEVRERRKRRAMKRRGRGDDFSKGSGGQVPPFLFASGDVRPCPANLLRIDTQTLPLPSRLTYA